MSKLSVCLFASSFLLVADFATPSDAASVTVSDTSAALPDVAQTMTGILVDAGLPLHHSGPHKFMVRANKFHCDARSNGALDAAQPQGGLPSLGCRINAQNVMGTKTGQKFGDAHATRDLLDKISTALPAVQFSDCASGGYCGTFAKSITCTIDTAIENFNQGGRWECLFVDGQ